MPVGVAMIVTVREGILAQCLKMLVDRLLVEFICLPFLHCYSVLGAGAKARTQSVAENVAYQFRFPIHYLQCALSAIGHAQSASVTLVFVDVYHCPDSHFILLEIGNP
jgi:hypothetical protein